MVGAVCTARGGNSFGSSGFVVVGTSDVIRHNAHLGSLAAANPYGDTNDTESVKKQHRHDTSGSYGA
jgi:hypothetical protein